MILFCKNNTILSKRKVKVSFMMLWMNWIVAKTEGWRPMNDEWWMNWSEAKLKIGDSQIGGIKNWMNWIKWNAHLLRHLGALLKTGKQSSIQNPVTSIQHEDRRMKTGIRTPNRRHWLMNTNSLLSPSLRVLSRLLEGSVSLKLIKLSSVENTHFYCRKSNKLHDEHITIGHTYCISIFHFQCQ